MVVNKSKKRGTTLLELMIVIPIIAIMVVAFSSIYITSIENYQQQFVQTNLETDGQTILDGIISNIKLASAVEPTYNPYTSGNQTIILEVPAIDKNQNFIYAGNNLVYDTIIYYLSGNSLHELTIANSSSARYAQNNLDIVLSSQVSVLTFAYSPSLTTPVTVSINMGLSSPVVRYNDSVVLNGKAKLRNAL